MTIPTWAEGAVFIAVAVAGLSLVMAIARKVFGLQRLSMPGGAGPEGAELRDGMEALHQRRQELEERVDFAERALTQQRQGERPAAPRPQRPPSPSPPSRMGE